MDLVVYRGVRFPVMRSISWEREPILDPSGTTYLYTRWRGNVVVTYNPGTIAYRNGALAIGPGIPPGAPVLATAPLTFGTMPAATDFAIRAWFEKPRGLLQVFSAGILVLTSPGTIGGVVASCDAATGPTIKVNNVTLIPGERRWDVHLSIEACVNEVQFNVSTRAGTASWSPIISNRWHAIGDTDFQQKTVRSYQGLVTVRGDLMNSAFGLGATAVIDSLRNAFASFKVPIGFQRVAVNVRVLPDGNSAEYTVVDAQQMWNKDARGNATIRCPAIELQIQDSAWVSRWTQNIVGAGVGNGWGVAGVNTVLALTGNGDKLMPKSYRRVNVRGWGPSNIRRDQLAAFCINVAKARLQDIALLDVSTEETMVTQDTNNFVDVTLTRSWDFSANGSIVATIAEALVGRIVPAIERFVNGLGGGLVAAPAAAGPGLGPAGLGGLIPAVGNLTAAGANAAANSMTDNPDYLYSPRADPPNAAALAVAQAAFAAELAARRPRDFVQATPPVLPGHPVGLTVNPVYFDAGTRGTYLGNLLNQVLEAPDTLPAPPP